MIQRIQSIYLLLTAILMAVTVFSPIVAVQQSIITLMQGIDLSLLQQDSKPYFQYLLCIILALVIISGLLAFITIFLYKKRKRQIMLCKINSFIIIAIYILLGVSIFSLAESMNIAFKDFKYGFILPLIALIFNILATSKIKADEKLVQSLNRIR